MIVRNIDIPWCGDDRVGAIKKPLAEQTIELPSGTVDCAELIPLVCV